MKLLRETIRKLLAEIVQIPIPDFMEPAPHMIKEKITKEMLDDVIKFLPWFEDEEYETVENLLQDTYGMSKFQIHELLNTALESKTYGAISDNVPDWVNDYFYETFHGEQ